MLRKTHFILDAGPLLLVLLIDGMGLGLAFPALNALILDPGSGFFAHPVSFGMRNFIYGAVVGLYMLCWFFGAAFLGDLSDQIGRKKSLLICLWGAFAGYLVGAIAITSHSFFLLLLGRVIGGLTSGSQPIAQAAIVDMSLEEHKTRNIGLISLATSLGFVLGPLLGGLLSDNNLVKWFNLATAFYCAAIIAFVNAILLQRTFKETYVAVGKKIVLGFSAPIKIFISAFQKQSIRNLSILLLISMFGWSSFFSFLPMFLLKTYNFSPAAVGFAMALLGVGFSFGNGVLVNYFSRHFTLASNFKYFSLLATGFALIMLFIPYPLVPWLVLVPMGACVAVVYTMVLALFSNQVTASEQGWVMGITGSIMALVFGINGIVVGALAIWNANLPMVAAVFGLGVAGLLTYWLYHPQKLEPDSDVAI